MSSFRSFISIPAPSSLQASASTVIQNLQSISSSVKWEKPEKLHITLKFLGLVDESLLKKITGGITSEVRNVESFVVEYSGLGAFPTLENPRTLWIGASGGEDLLQLSSLVESVCSSFGIPSEGRTFHAHVTIGRVKSSHNQNRLTASAKSVTLEAIAARCSELYIMKSELHPTGSQYTVVQSIPLKS